MSVVSPTYRPMAYLPSPQPQPAQPAKIVTFELVLPGGAQARARLHMRVHIWPHDDTESIVSTVKNFFGIYPTANMSVGVSFESQEGNTLIARYENFSDGMVVLVRAVEEPPVELHPAYRSQAAQVNGIVARPSDHSARDAAPTNQAQSASPMRRSPTPVNGHNVFASGFFYKQRQQSTKNDGDYCDSVKSYSSGDSSSSSSASNRPKDPIPNTEISVENIVEGGRRKRAKFESSELPLFAPLQMPATTSNPSGSPVRRINHHHRSSLPFVSTNQNPFTNVHLLVSPQARGAPSGAAAFTTPGPDSRHFRNSMSYSGGKGILPTPDPTVGSCVSDEDKDVAIQLMRLCGETSNVSAPGRPSVSMFEDAFGSRPDGASLTSTTSDGVSDSDDDAPAARRQKLDGSSHGMYPTAESQFAPFDPNSPLAGRLPGDAAKSKPKLGLKTALPASKPKPPKIKGARPVGIVKPKKMSSHLPNGPMSPPSLSPSRKQSVGSLVMSAFGNDDDDVVDLSSKPRCQRCRKSKKGCDRQRPCGRCKDAGLTAAECISEDEGNGRKGRYGRHMGVPLKKDETSPMSPPLQSGPVLLPAPMVAGDLGIMSSEAILALDKGKKRKR
jgi:hypothetical protein